MSETRLTSHKLEFQNPVFFDPPLTQLTVRKGEKWSRRVSPGTIVTVAETGGEDLGEVEITAVLLTRLADIPLSILEREHDPSCRTYSGLVSEMQRVYPGFEETDVVTALFFHFQLRRQGEVD